MRLDVFLKISRLVKRRAVAKEFCDAGLVLVGGTPAKAGREVRPGDIITLELARRRVVAEVLAVPAGNVPKADASGLYRVVEETVKEDEVL
jgi:ribosomal 50S subunit-recycling heat shock protein